MIYVSLSQSVNWQVMPWQWQKAPEYWIDRLLMYFEVHSETDPIVEAKRRTRAEAVGR